MLSKIKPQTFAHKFENFLHKKEHLESKPHLENTTNDELNKKRSSGMSLAVANYLPDINQIRDAFGVNSPKQRTSSQLVVDMSIATIQKNAKNAIKKEVDQDKFLRSMGDAAGSQTHHEYSFRTGAIHDESNHPRGYNTKNKRRLRAMSAGGIKKHPNIKDKVGDKNSPMHYNMGQS